MGSAGQRTACQIGEAELYKVLKGNFENQGKMSSQITKDEQKEEAQMGRGPHQK